MHGAPSVSYPVGRSRIAGRLFLLFWLCGACCAAAAWLRLGSKADWRSGLLVVSVLVAGAAAWAGSQHRARPSVLSFDGLRWSIGGVAGMQAADASVALDGQSWLLVRLALPRRAARWVWLERRAMPERWQDLRCAVYSRPVPASEAPTDARSAPSGAQHPLS